MNRSSIGVPVYLESTSHAVIADVRRPRKTMKPRLRFSLRTLLLIPVCVGLFFALGEYYSFIRHTPDEGVDEGKSQRTQRHL